MKILLSLAFCCTLSVGIAQTSLTEVSPDFTFSTNDLEDKLSNYRGKVVYLSFWASWCKPCINNFHKYEKIRNQLQEMGVVLLNINIDRDEADYQKSLKKHPIYGVNGYTGADPVLMEQYQLYSIPSYEIIQKDGRLYYLSEDPERNILDEFKKLTEVTSVR